MMCRMNCALWAWISVALLGCGSQADPNGPTTVPTKATVTYQGEPVEGATITFASADSRGAVGRTDRTGTATMWTFESGDGVIPGTYEVAIRKLEVLALPDPETVSPEEYTRISQEMNAALAGEPTHLVPKRYSIPKESGLTAEVQPTGKNSFTFSLED